MSPEHAQTLIHAFRFSFLAPSARIRVLFFSTRRKFFSLRLSSGRGKLLFYCIELFFSLKREIFLSAPPGEMKFGDFSP